MARTVAADLAAQRPLNAAYGQDARRWERLDYPGLRRDDRDLRADGQQAGALGLTVGQGAYNAAQ
jgi:hypothetical protein